MATESTSLLENIYILLSGSLQDMYISTFWLSVSSILTGIKIKWSMHIGLPRRKDKVLKRKHQPT